MMMHTCHYTFVLTHRMYKPMSETSCKLQILGEHKLYRFIHDNKCTTLGEDVDKGGGYTRLSGTWKISVFSILLGT